jgi:Protein of unknown function (DUF1266)
MIGCIVLSPARRWALAPSAILTRYNLDDPTLLGGVPPGDAAATEAREMLAGGWEIVSEDTARAELALLLERGARAEYDAVRASGKGTARERRFIKQHGAELGDRSLIAWDLANVSHVAGAAFLAGLLDEAAAWAWCMTAARMLQPKFSSWEAFGNDYLLGYQYWEGEDDRGPRHVYRALVLEHDGTWAIPWNTPLT